MEANNADEGIQVSIGYGADGSPTTFYVGDVVHGRFSACDAEVLVALLRDLADSIESTAREQAAH